MENQNINQENLGVESQVKPTMNKKKVNASAIVFGIMALLSAGVAIFFGVKYYEPKEESEPITIEQIKEETKIEIAASTMANDYKEVVSVVESLTEGIGGARDRYENSNMLMYKPVDLNTFIPMRLTVKKQVTNSDNGEANMDVLIGRLEGAGFKSIGTLPNLGSAPAPDEYGYLNSSSNIFCGIYEDTAWSSPTNGYEYVLLQCAKTDWTWLTEDDKALISELEAAYREKEGEYPIELNIGVAVKIRDSEYAPYQSFGAGVKGAVGLFYRTGPDAKWQFFTSVQGPLECSEYNTDDLRKAFAGDYCYNGEERSTVQP